MVSINGIQNRTVLVERPNRPSLADQEPVKGKSADSVGHRAKAAVAESGDHAPNAIRKAAAMLAKLTVESANTPEA